MKQKQLHHLPDISSYQCFVKDVQFYLLVGFLSSLFSNPLMTNNFILYVKEKSDGYFSVRGRIYIFASTHEPRRRLIFNFSAHSLYMFLHHIRA